mgnify:CR=1 FL=1
MRLVMPALFIRLPARMKNGTASSGKLSMTADHPVDDDERRQIPGQQDVHQRRARHGDRDGHPRRHEGEKRTEQRRRHTCPSMAISGVPARSSLGAN